MPVKKRNIFIDGPIAPEFIAQSIAKHQSKTAIGAHNIFLGQVREDKYEAGNTSSITFSVNREMAEKILGEIREETFAKYNLSCMHIYHSLGDIEVGEICFFVFLSSPHRTIIYEATDYVVDRIKSEVPIFGKEILDTGNVEWKKNKF